ncbi:MAG: lasso peptide biosynthesis B2 protein [Pseudomonadota bacterium]
MISVLRRLTLYSLVLGVIIVTRLGLWMLRYQTVRAWLVRPCREDPQPERRLAVYHVARVVARLARLIPDASCLTQSIACQAVLSWRNIPSSISMGVKKEDGGTLRWHAWVTWNDVIILEGNEEVLAGFQKLLDLPTPVRAQGSRPSTSP